MDDVGMSPMSLSPDLYYVHGEEDVVEVSDLPSHSSNCVGEDVKPPAAALGISFTKLAGLVQREVSECVLRSGHRHRWSCKRCHKRLSAAASSSDPCHCRRR